MAGLDVPMDQLAEDVPTCLWVVAGPLTRRPVAIKLALIDPLKHLFAWDFGTADVDPAKAASMRQ